ncbi:MULTISPECIES: hypothetical protein [unclassified Marinimicrobium]|jgi:hypothetical protein|uniref:hypothetical protein n=1 Tax=unclassified Marinimicrobium TaxID=2632100 RepID=UPI000C5DA6CA|nr:MULTISPECIES: hypothetical protein [unclassified Marinimicrobium]MAN50821.1 hypothetical protein [Marinimicrobium sp.]|tara:strand:- start:52 stop:327 length:276 start_codon:yes stop_codon:yes gene_type:complete
MALSAVPNPDYHGEAGVEQVRQLRNELVQALRAEDWWTVRELDRACAGLVERVIAANGGDGTALVRALSELKGVYANLIEQCQEEVLKLAL